MAKLASILTQGSLKAEVAQFELPSAAIFNVDLTSDDDDAVREAGLQHMGDLMGWRTTFCPLPAGFSALERMVLTANGNLQRLISSYYNAAVQVRLVYNHAQAEGEYARKVELTVFGKVFCVATSRVHLTGREYMRLVEEEKVGLGQLFRHQNLLPYFTLLRVGRSSEHFWRTYLLHADGIACLIHEDFPANLFSLEAAS